MTKSSIMNKVFLYKILCIVIGLMIIGLGAFFTIISGLGSDPFNVLGHGLRQYIPVQAGTMSTMLNTTAFLVVLITKRSYVKINTILSTILIGSSMNFWDYLIGDFILSLELNFVFNVLIVLLSVVLIGFGVAVMQKINLGMVPNDAVPYIIYEKINTKKKMSYRVVRIAYDVSQALFGIILGGLFGIGTILIAFLVGPSIQFWVPHVSNMIDKLFKKLGYQFE